VHVLRLGRRDVSTNSRPLMIQLARYASENLIMESLYTLKNAEQKFKCVVVSYDMTEMSAKNWLLKQKGFHLTIPRGNTYTGFEVSRGR